MAKQFDIVDELVTANRILAKEGIVDSFGHVSVRHPTRKDRYLLSRARAPERIEAGDIMEFTLEGDPVDAKGRKPYLERFIHGAAYEMRPDVMARFEPSRWMALLSCAASPTTTQPSP